MHADTKVYDIFMDEKIKRVNDGQKKTVQKVNKIKEEWNCNWYHFVGFSVAAHLMHK